MQIFIFPGIAFFSVQPETSNFVECKARGKRKSGAYIQGADTVREHFSATEQHGNRVKGVFPDGHSLILIFLFQCDCRKRAPGNVVIGPKR